MVGSPASGLCTAGYLRHLAKLARPGSKSPGCFPIPLYVIQKWLLPPPRPTKIASSILKMTAGGVKFQSKKPYQTRYVGIASAVLYNRQAVPRHLAGKIATTTRLVGRPSRLMLVMRAALFEWILMQLRADYSTGNKL